MYPVYRCMEPFPQPVSHQKNHTPYPHHYNPGWEVIPPQVKIDPTESPLTLKPWPCSGNFAYPNPTECHGYCNHSYPPGHYSYRPPHSYLSLHPPMYYYGPHPPHHDVYSPYFIPPPYYPAEQARYEYDKNMVRDHCCGCPNHTCNGKADSKVKIEEEKPDLERKGSDSNGLNKLQNYPYPIICMPPGYMKDGETDKPLESDSKTLNGWVPLDLNSVGSLNKDGDEKRIKDQQTEDKKPQLQWPIIWFPGYDKAEDEKKDVKDIEVSPKVEEDAPQKFKIIPVKLPENKNRGEKPGVAEDGSGNGHSSAAAEKDIKPRSATTKKETNTKNIEVKQLEENGEKKSETAAKKPASSPVKTHKLPPVCLRVDPLPKKKNDNGTSRSPSPPAAKERGHHDLKKQELVVDKDKDGRSKNEETKIMNVEEKPLQISEDKERKSKTREIKVVDMEEKTLQTSEARGGLPKEKEMQEVKVEEKMVAQRGSGEQQQLMEPASQESDITTSDITTNEDQAQCQVRDPTNLSEEVGPVIKKAGIDGREYENTEEGIEVAEGKKVDKKKAMRKILCNVEAAVLIQSAYRGYEVRRWEPLKKLRQIARIRKQVDEIRERIQDIKSSAKLQDDEKQRVVLNETIMSLLLQLDTIQGLHPDVREIRKSVARELVCLQEKLDSFATQTTTESPIEKACRDDDKTTQENDSVLMESTSMPEETSEQLLNGDVAPDASQSNEATGTAISVEEQHEVKQKEILEMPLVDAEWFESKREEHTNHPTLVEHTSSVTSSEELAEVHTENDGRCSSEVEVLVGSPPSVNVEQPEEDSIDLDTVRDEEDSAVNDKLVKSLQIDGYLVSIVDKLSKAAPMVAEEEAAPTLEQVPLVKDDQVESQEANEEAISGPQSPETMLTGDGCVNSVAEEVLPDMNRTLEIEVEEVDTMSVVKEEHDSEHVDLPLISEQSSLAVKEKDAECKPVEEEGSLEDAENQLLYSVSDIDATVKIATPGLDDQGNNVEVVSGGNKRSDAEAMVVMAENPKPEEVGECNTDKGISEEDKVESPSKEKGMNPSMDIFGATTIPHEIEMESQTPEAEVSVEAITAVESLPPHSTLESDVEQGSNAENDSLSVSCGDPVPPSEVELQKEDKDLAGENDKLKEMLEKLLQAGKQQLTIISDLNGRVRDLEKKLAKKKKMKIRRQKAVASSCIMHKDNLVNQMASATSMV